MVIIIEYGGNLITLESIMVIYLGIYNVNLPVI